MSQTVLNNDRLTFTGASATTGEISFDGSNNLFNFDRQITANGGIVATSMTINPGASVNFSGYVAMDNWPSAPAQAPINRPGPNRQEPSKPVRTLPDKPQ